MLDIKVVAFDCDGVLFDTTKANKAYYNEVLLHFGRATMTPEQFVFAHMHTVDETYAFLFDGDEKILKAAHEYRNRMDYGKFIGYMEIEPYLKPLLTKIRPKYKTAIATNRTDTMNRVLSEHALEGYFDLVVSVRDVKRPKPYPDPLIKILDHFKVGPHHAIYVGDSQLDELAAKAAGVPFVAYNNPSLSAVFYIRSLRELENILKGCKQ